MKTDNKVIPSAKNVPPIKTSFRWKKAAAENPRSFDKVCKETYQIIVKRKTSAPVKNQEKWLSEGIFSNVPVNWENTYQLPFLYTMETK